MRKLVVGLLCIILFVSLLGAALTTSDHLTFSNPSKLETWLASSGLYDSVTRDIASATEKAISGQTTTPAPVSGLQTAVQSAFSPTELQKDVNAFIDGNYAWLKGQTKTPAFNIDLTSVKQAYATQAASYVQSSLTALPTCAPLTPAQLQNVNPFTLTCRPSNLDPKLTATQIQAQIGSSTEVLSNSVITPNTINLNSGGNEQSKPYYSSLSGLPTVYQWGNRLPIIFGVLAGLCAIGVFFLAARKRYGIKFIGIFLAIAGVILVIVKLVADAVSNRVTHAVATHLGSSAFISTFTNFGKSVESSLVKTDFNFAVGYLALAVALFILLLATRNRIPKPAKVASSSDSHSSMDPEDIKLVNRRPQPNVDIVSNGSNPTSTAPPLPNNTATQEKKPPKPRLIQ
jgi:hypothetical protein